ncbi:MAG: murein biosynthesis integral membrane protein MurJ [Deltaproteobacteria bacterium]|nr:murein biosynthesis integral membrane protein MurJ [Deltaproteobacteria bacterium]MBI3295664.1 murein biosynthesis integral membrane protein MurJ [Deltaproteobacteria bacterium]
MAESPNTIQTNARLIRRAAVLLMVSILLSRIVGFFREWILARTVGASGQTDVYYASFTIPDFLNYMMAAGALSISFIPVVNDLKVKGQEAVARELFRAIATIFGGWLIFFIFVAEVWAPQLSQLIAPGFNPQQIEMLTQLLRIILPAQIFFYWGGLATSVQHVNGHFWWSALSPILYNLFIIVFGVAFHESLGVAAFSWGVLAGSVVGNGILLGYGAYRCGYTFTPILRLSTDVRAGFKRYLWLSLPIMLGFSLVVTDEWITKYLASSLEPKLLSWLSYARTELRIPVAIIGQAAGIASFPFLAQLWSEKRFLDYGRTLILEAQKLWALATVCAVILYFEARPITEFIYGGGKLQRVDIEGIAQALVVYSIGMFFWTAQVLIARAFYASQRTWLPSIIGTLLSVMGFPVYLILMNQYSYVGLAMAGTLGIAAYTLILWGFLMAHFRRSCPELRMGELYRFCLAWFFVLAVVWGIGKGVGSLGIYRQTQLSALYEIVLFSTLALGVAYILQRTLYRKLTASPLF